MAEWEKLYGSFDRKSYEDDMIKKLPSESAFYHGEIVRWSREVVDDGTRTLLVGEGKKATEIIKSQIGLKETVTIGLLKDVDFKWDFEESPPSDIGKFDLIISQAILEHLIDPYKHVRDMSSMLAPGGYLLIHTVLPGFIYHRYPIDAVLFYPDWFEEVRKRLNLTVYKKRINMTHIFYMFKAE